MNDKPDEDKFNYQIVLIDSLTAQSVCRDVTANLPEYFGIPEANERYEKGILNRVSFAAISSDDHVGMATLEFPFANNANIYWMAVKRKFQGNGVGSLLIENIVRYCCENGYTSLTVETLSPKADDANYLKTYQFYEKMGFKPLFELNTYSSDYLMVYMQRLI